MAPAAFVAGDARADGGQSPAPHFADDLRIGQLRAPEGDKIQFAGVHRLVEFVDQPVQPADCNHRDVDPLAHRQRVRKEIAGCRQAGDDGTRLVIAGRDVEGVDMGRDHLGESQAVSQGEAAFVGLFDAHPIDDRKFDADRFANGGNGLQGEARAIFQRAAIFVGSPICLGERNWLSKYPWAP